MLRKLALSSCYEGETPSGQSAGCPRYKISSKLRAQSRKPKAESRKPKAESLKPKAESRKPKA